MPFHMHRTPNAHPRAPFTGPKVKFPGLLRTRKCAVRTREFALYVQDRAEFPTVHEIQPCPARTEQIPLHGWHISLYTKVQEILLLAQ